MLLAALKTFAEFPAFQRRLIRFLFSWFAAHNASGIYLLMLGKQRIFTTVP